MRNPAGFYLFAFHAIASFTSFAGVVVAGMALILPEADWDRFVRGAILFVVSGLIARFASQALEEAE
jgi:hypothetical protein